MLAAFVAVTAVIAPPTASAPRAADPPCRTAAIHASTPPAGSSRKLGELPPGLLQLAVDKRVGGCRVTVLPIRDANGNHRMILRTEAPGFSRAERSRRQAGPERQR